MVYVGAMIFVALVENGLSNTWQGKFVKMCRIWLCGQSPGEIVFQSNGSVGLYEHVGNVWQWCIYW